MPFANDQKEEVKSRTDIVQLISEYLPVKKAGVRFVACCPFHHEKTPSFSISPDNQFWYCFGCGEGGDAFGFVMRMEGLDFPDALRLLARKAGVTLREGNREESTERARLQECNELAARFWHEVLMNQPAGERARKYVDERRRLTKETLEDWKIGYAPDSWDATLGFLRQRGFHDDELLKAGLVLRSERTGNLFDRFRGRVMFPIRDVHGHTVGFTARVMPGPDGKDPKDEPKYMNTPQTPLYDKSRVVFGLDRARQEIRRQNLAVLVEGNLDVVASHQAKVTNVVASSGTALTEEHLRLLKRFTDRLVLAFDVDTAGENASRRGVELALHGGFTVRVLTLPEGAGKDADDAIRKDPAIWTKAIEDAVPYLEWFMNKIRSRLNQDDPEAKRRAADDLIAEVAKVQQPVERSHWVRQMAELFRTPESLLRDAVEARAREHARTASRQAGPSGAVVDNPLIKRARDRYEMLSESLMAMLLRWPELAVTVFDRLDPAEVAAEERPLYTDLVLAYNTHRSGEVPQTGSVPPGPVVSNIPPERQNVLMLLAEKECDGLTEEARREIAIRLIGGIKELHKAQRRKELTEAMAGAERRGDSSAIKQISEQLNELLS
jgi:DNA primase